jgi:hypothetical protein
MCDYSLTEMRNRLAADGDELLVHRFPSGSLGLRSGRRRLPEVLFPSAVVAVCVPPGARLALHDIPVALQRRFRIGSSETVTFVQQSLEVFRHRDAVRFDNGSEALLQDLAPGQRVIVLTLDLENQRHPGRETEPGLASPRL